MPPANARKLGELIRRARTKKGLSLRAAAAQADMEWGHLARIERGDYASPAMHYLQSLAQVLDIPMERLLKVASYRDKLPELTPYLRTKYGLSESAAAELEQHFQALRKQPAPKKGGR